MNVLKITFVEPDGTETNVEAGVGVTLMETARNAGVTGIEAECGGACACSTCHIYVGSDWFDRLPPLSDMEADMLEFAWSPAPNASRLSCQINLTQEMDGLRVTLPARQG